MLYQFEMQSFKSEENLPNQSEELDEDDGWQWKQGGFLYFLN